MLKKILSEICVWAEALLVKNTPGRLGFFIRKIYWSFMFKKNLKIHIGTGCAMFGIKNITLGQNIKVMPDCSFYATTGGKLKIGDRFGASYRVMIDAADGGGIVIGNDVSIGPNVVMRASNHRYKRKDVLINRQGHTGGKIVIGNDVWIGANCTILAGAVIGEGSVIGAGAVVNKVIPPYSLAGGVPAKVIKEGCRS